MPLPRFHGANSPRGPIRQADRLVKHLYRAGLRGWHLQAGCFGTIGLCVGFWIRAKTLGQDERGNAERRALFVGLWPPTFWLIGKSLEDHEAALGTRTKRLRR